MGFLFADDPDDLIMIIDEVTDPDECEYVEMPDGGIMWGSPAMPVPIKIDKDDPDDSKELPVLPWRGAEFSESWWSVTYGYGDEKWINFFPENPLKPRPPAPRRLMGPARVLHFRKRP